MPQQPDSSASLNCSEDVRRMLGSFRVAELQSLLIEFGASRYGKKQELILRAFNLLKGKKSLAVEAKIQQIYRTKNPSDPLHDEHFEMSRSTVGGAAAYISLNNRCLPEASRAPMIPGLGPHLLSPGDSGIPLNPDLKLVKLPYYDVVATLLRPTTLLPRSAQRTQENFFSFTLSPSQVLDTSYLESQPLPRFEVQMRFAFLDTSVEQKDDFPSTCVVRMNEKMVALPAPIPTNKPNVEPKRPSRPVNLTNYVRPSANQPQRISVSWNAEASKNWTVSVYYVKHVTSQILLQRLKDRGIQTADLTKSLIRQKLAGDDSEIATTSLRVSLQCPLGKMRMSIPCKVRSCNHMQCFDGNLFLMMNEKKPTWVCPVCDKPAPFDELITDGYFVDVLSQSDSDVTEIQVEENGDWTPMIRDDDNKAVLAPQKRRDGGPPGTSKALLTPKEEIGETKVVIMKSSGSLIAPPGTSSSAIKGGKEAVEVVIDLTEDSDEEETEPSRSGPPSTVSIQGGNGQSPDRSSVGSAQSAFSTPPIVNQLSNNCRSKGQSAPNGTAQPISPAVIDLDSPPAPSATSPVDPVDAFINTVDTMDKSTQSVVSRSRPPTTSPPAPVPARVDASRLDDRGQKRTSESQIHPPPVKRFAPNAYELPTVAEPDSTARLPSPRSAPPLVGTSGNFMFSSGAAPTSSIPTRYVTTAPGHWGELVSRQAPITQATPFPSQSIAQKTTGRDFVPNNNFYNGSFAGSSMSTTNRSQISSAPAHQQSMGNIYSMPQFRHMSFNSAAPQQQSSGGPPPLRYGPPPNAHMRPAEGFSQSAYMLNLLNQQMQQRNPAFHMNNLMGQMNGTGDFEPLEMELQKFMHGCLPSGPK